MKLFIWESLENLTEHYHDEGGAAVVAVSLQKAILALPSKCNANAVKPTKVLKLEGTPKPEVFIFPDSGCC